MSPLSARLIMHPAISSSLKVGGTTVGRDKLYRAVQYFARFFAWYLLKQGYSKDSIAKWTNLKSALGLSRKLMRIGKPVEHLQAAFKAVIEIPSPFLRSLAIGRQIGYAAYLFNDTLLWADKIKFRPMDKETLSKVNKRAAQFWLLGLSFSLVSGLVKMQHITAKVRASRSKSYTSDKETERKAEAKALYKQSSAVRYQLLQDSLDILLPSATLEYHSLNEGVLGAAGFVSSIMGLNTQIKKVLG